MSRQEDEFGRIYRFLHDTMPLYFSVKVLPDGAFAVGEEFDEDEFVASFLMPHEAYSIALPTLIQEFLRTLEYDWAVYGSFDIVEPFTADGKLNPSPRFKVTKSTVSGDTDAQEVRRRYGAALRRWSDA